MARQTDTALALLAGAVALWWLSDSAEATWGPVPASGAPGGAPDGPGGGGFLAPVVTGAGAVTALVTAAKTVTAGVEQIVGAVVTATAPTAAPAAAATAAAATAAPVLAPFDEALPSLLDAPFAAPLDPLALVTAPAADALPALFGTLASEEAQLLAAFAPAPAVAAEAGAGFDLSAVVGDAASAVGALLPLASAAYALATKPETSVVPVTYSLAQGASMAAAAAGIPGAAAVAAPLVAAAPYAAAVFALPMIAGMIDNWLSPDRTAQRIRETAEWLSGTPGAFDALTARMDALTFAALPAALNLSGVPGPKAYNPAQSGALLAGLYGVDLTDYIALEALRAVGHGALATAWLARIRQEEADALAAWHTAGARALTAHTVRFFDEGQWVEQLNFDTLWADPIARAYYEAQAGENRP